MKGDPNKDGMQFPLFAVVVFAIAIVATIVGVAVFAAMTPARTQCVFPSSPITIAFSQSRWPSIASHIADARDRYPKILHIDRTDAKRNRYLSTKVLPSRHDEGLERDEFPPAATGEGGIGADVRYVPSRENESSGAYFGSQIRPYCDGSHIRLVVIP